MRWLALIIILFAPSTAAGFLFAGTRGALTGACLALVVLLLALFRAERVIAGVHELKPSRKGVSGYRVVIFRDPSPSAFVARSWMGNGTILLSQGLVAILDDSELRSVVGLASLRLRSRSMVLQSVCAVLAIWTLKFAPYGWSGLVLSSSRRPIQSADVQSFSAFSAVHFLVLFPLVRLFLGLGKKTPLKKGSAVLDDDASRKLAYARQVWESPVHPGISALSIV